MSDDAAIRRENLRRLCVARGWGARDLEARTSARYTYWRDLLKDSRKSFGEKAARSIEEQLELPRGWLDEADAKVQTAHGCGGAIVATRWIFTPELFTALRGADAATIRRYENVLRVLAGLDPL